MNKQVVTFGEILLRLTPPGNERLLQSPRLTATFGGAEANVAVSLSRFGLDAAFVTVLPRNALGDACVDQLRAHGVDVSMILRGEGRMGIYFLERGAASRPGKVLYDRTGSSLAVAGPEMIDWEQVCMRGGWFHLSGITPAISQSAADSCLEAVSTAKARGLTVSCDYNYRGKLWNYGKSPPEVMADVMESVDIGIGSAHSCQMLLGIEAGPSGGRSTEEGQARAVCEAVLSQFSHLRLQAIPWRRRGDDGYLRMAAGLHDGDDFIVSSEYEVSPVIEGVGAGDAFAAGLIYSLIVGESLKQALEFATGAACLKYSVPGDWNLVNAGEVERLLSGGRSPWIQR